MLKVGRKRKVITFVGFSPLFILKKKKKLNCKQQFTSIIITILRLLEYNYPLDCLQSAFSLKIRLVLTSSSPIANHDVIITIRDCEQTREDGLMTLLQ